MSTPTLKLLNLIHQMNEFVEECRAENQKSIDEGKYTDTDRDIYKGWVECAEAIQQKAKELGLTFPERDDNGN